MVPITLDDIDLALLAYLQQDARVTHTELARRVDLSPPGLQRRIRKLEDTGIISRYVTLVNREALGFDMLCFVQVTLQRHEPEAVRHFKEAIQQMAEVMECHHITGEYDYLLKVVVRSRSHLETFLVEKLTPLPGMDKIRTSLVLREIKTTTSVPLDTISLNGQEPPE
jgi:Lrp/AsnC family transcriptional regulator, leucine-responsive regulatory protein